MAFFYRLYRIIAVISWMALIALLAIPYRLKGGWSSARRLSGITQLWCKGLARILNLRVTISGNIPKSNGNLIVSNHLSYLDIITHGSVIPLRFTPKSDIKKWPLLGRYVDLNMPVWVERMSRRSAETALKEFEETLRQGMNLIVYPEGTSTNGKNGIRSFKSTPFEAAIAGNTPIIPVLISYNEIQGRPEIAWYGDMELLPHVWQLLALPSIEAHLSFMPPILPSSMLRKELAAHVHEIMTREFIRTQAE